MILPCVLRVTKCNRTRNTLYLTVYRVFIHSFIYCRQLRSIDIHIKRTTYTIYRRLTYYCHNEVRQCEHVILLVYGDF